MMSHNSSRTQASQRPGPGKRMVIPGWATILLAFILSVATISFLWYRAQKSVVEPYYESRRKSVSLHPVVQNVQVQVEYPRRISRDDRGVQHHKRLVVSVTKTEVGPSEVISLAVKPVSGYIHFLAENGSDRSGQLTITATHGITEAHTLYIEHPNVPPGGPISLSLQILPPTGVITEPVNVKKSDFAIEEEPFIEGTIRGVVSLWPWQNFLLAFLAIPGALLKTLWDRRKGMADLHEKMKQAWEGWKIDDIRSMYGDYQGLILFHIPFFRSKALDIPGHRSVELLHRRAETRFHFEQARDALQRKATQDAERHLATALEWDLDYEKIRPVYERVYDLEKEYEAWWIEPMLGFKEFRRLSEALEDKEQTQAEVRKRIVNVLGHVSLIEAKRTLERTLREDNALSVQTQAAWMLARRPRPEKSEERKLRSVGQRVVREWLEAFPARLIYNPFEAVIAEGDYFLERHFFRHPAYLQLLHDVSQSVALFADPGGGKTSCRRILKSFLESEYPTHLVVEYTNFSALVRETRKISVEDHIQAILRQISVPLGIRARFLSPLGGTWQEQVKRFPENAQTRGYAAIHVLVDNVDGYAETQANPRIAELLIRHLVANFDLLDTAGLRFTFFLPLSLKERLLGCGGFTTGRLRIVDMEWTRDLLSEVLRERLKAASSPCPRSRVDSLKAFTSEQIEEGFFGVLLENLLLSKAQGSPRRLILLVNMLFQHRAQVWYESGKSPEELYITMTDWAILLEHLLQQGDVT